MNPTSSMYQAATGIFRFSNGFELRVGGFDPLYETSGMLSEMFDVPLSIAAAAATASTELLEQALPPNYQAYRPAGESKSDFSLQQLPSISADTAAANATQLFLMNPQPKSPSSSTSLQGPGGSSFGTSTVPNTVLRNSKYVKVAQELLEEFCSVGRGKLKKNKFGRNKTNPCSNPGGCSPLTKDLPPLSPADRIEHQRRKVRLLAMLDEVESRYKLYCEEMRMMVKSLDLVMGNGAAVPYTALAQKAMSRHFRCLKDSISAQLKRSYEVLGEKDGTAGEKRRLRMPEHSLRQQRGLPERSVNILRAWLFQHFLHPYPSDADKHLLARQTGLSRNQVSNWFINARVRLWKPMVEEMYQQETEEEDGERNPNNSSNNAETSAPSSTGAAIVAASTTTTATPADRMFEISATENDPSLIEINRQCFSFSENKTKQCTSLTTTATEAAAPTNSQPFTATNAGGSLTLGLRHAGNMADNLQMHFL
ncbi:BEL1-like homeodomain 4, SAWTOOTH 2 [Hibiscus trionum]|uniref:BEL1-like homeodomain 4, SAWTOOTH 2 n=1 Tax=Hibiscus trionum TaxID=183268 RepID=A0A9W7MB96_HIBTR|nr:BEL1-like homeodomain 4, SAWTOOTH 2 [Hibiscus trionum]